MPQLPQSNHVELLEYERNSARRRGYHRRLFGAVLPEDRIITRRGLEHVPDNLIGRSARLYEVYFKL